MRFSASVCGTSPTDRCHKPRTANGEIAMALAQNPKVLLLDEPFAGLSIDERRDVQETLRAIPRDVTIVMIEHNMDVALDFAERITLLHFGKVIVEGTRAEVVADPHTREVYLGH
jgi:branched-chain amino acid transport system ATP-binding protein